LSTEARIFHAIRNFLEKAPDTAEPFIGKNIAIFVGKLENFSPKNYGL